MFTKIVSMKYSKLELDEGIYKVRQYGLYCLMKVMKREGRLYYSMGADPELSISDLNKYFSHPVDIVGKVTIYDPIINVKVRIEWQDLRQDHFEIVSTTTNHLRKVFDEYPLLLERLKSPYI